MAGARGVFHNVTTGDGAEALLCRVRVIGGGGLCGDGVGRRGRAKEHGNGLQKARRDEGVVRPATGGIDVLEPIVAGRILL
jgi:hypothetical protein